LEKNYWKPDTIPSGHLNWTVVENMVPYRTDGYPAIVYRTDEQNTFLSDKSAVLAPYITEQFALFVTGERALSEFDQYLAELKSMGMDEYEQFHIDEYNDYLESLG